MSTPTPTGSETLGDLVDLALHMVAESRLADLMYDFGWTVEQALCFQQKCADMKASRANIRSYIAQLEAARPWPGPLPGTHESDLHYVSGGYIDDSLTLNAVMQYRGGLNERETARAWSRANLNTDAEVQK